MGILGEFEGKEVVNAAVVLTNAGDGLSDSMSVDPTIIHHGDKGFIVIEWECKKVRMDPVEKAENLLTRVHIIKAGAAAFIDDDVVREAIVRQKTKIAEARDAEKIAAELAKGQAQVDGFQQAATGSKGGTKLGHGDDDAEGLDARVAREEAEAARREQTKGGMSVVAGGKAAKAGAKKAPAKRAANPRKNT